MRQRYISHQLLHFVGRGLSEPEQFELLLKILSSGWLTHPPHDPSLSGSVGVSTAGDIADGTLVVPTVVCFCDIPRDDLDIHMSKYSRFGLALPKPYLLKRGANPVYYVAKSSRSAEDPSLTRAEQFKEKMLYVAQWGDFYLEAKEAFQASGQDSALRLVQAFEDFQTFLNFEVWSYLKMFDATLSEDDPDNFYMEREWRIVGNVQFALDDISTIVVPAEYGRPLRQSVPEYAGEVWFSDTQR
jgi:hypothetical protein